MKRILTIVAALSCLGVVLVSLANARDDKKEEKPKTKIDNVYFDWNGYFSGLKGLKGLEGLKAVDGLKALKGLEGLRGLQALKGLDGCEGLDDLDKTLDELCDDLDDFDEMHGSLEDLYLHIPPALHLALPLPLAAKTLVPYSGWNWNDYDVWTDAEEMSAEEHVRLEALSGLRKLDGDEAIPMLEKILREEEHPAIRSKALSILRSIDDERVIPILGDVAKNDSDIRVRKKAIRYLGESGEKRALEILKEILEK
jgi:hypothetical protein